MAYANIYNRCKWCHGRPAVAVWSRCGGPVLLYMCPHTSCCWQARCYTSIYVSSYYYICVLILGAAGRAGVSKALQIVHKELDVTMGLCGLTDIEQVDSKILYRNFDPAV